MANTMRTLVLGTARFLGTAITRRLADSGGHVTALVGGIDPESEFFTSGLPQRVHTTGGRAADAARLRQIVAQHEIDLIVQCDTGEFPEQTHSITKCVLSAAATSERRPAVLVPLRREEAACRPRFESVPALGLRAAFVQLPELFGTGELDLSRWAAAQFARAALDWPLTPPMRHFGVLHVDRAAAAILEAFDTCTDANASGHWLTVDSEGTSRELLAALRDEVGPRLYGGAAPMQDIVPHVLEWYRARADRWREILQPTAFRAAA